MDSQSQLDVFAILQHVERINPLVFQLAVEKAKNDFLQAELHEAQHAAQDTEPEKDSHTEK